MVYTLAEKMGVANTNEQRIVVDAPSLKRETVCLKQDIRKAEYFFAAAVRMEDLAKARDLRASIKEARLQLRALQLLAKRS